MTKKERLNDAGKKLVEVNQRNYPTEGWDEWRRKIETLEQLVTEKTSELEKKKQGTND